MRDLKQFQYESTGSGMAGNCISGKNEKNCQKYVWRGVCVCMQV